MTIAVNTPPAISDKVPDRMGGHLVTPLSPEIHAKLGLKTRDITPNARKVAQGLHKMHGLSTSLDETKPVALKLPEGLTLDKLIATVQATADPLVEKLQQLLFTSSPALEGTRMPLDTPYGPGWWRYDGRQWKPSECPVNIVAVVDFETTWTDPARTHWFPVCCVVISSDGCWYLWQVDTTLDEPDALLDFTEGNFLAGWNCVPWGTEALTPSGWVPIENIKAGDTVMGYADGYQQWTKVTGLVDGGTQEVLELGNARRKWLATGDHRWLTHSRTGDRPWDKPAYSTTNTLAASNTQRLAAINTAEAILPKGVLSPDEAALIAWLWSDGSVTARRFKKKEGYYLQGSITQKAGYGIEAIEALLARMSIDAARHTVKGCGSQRWYIRGVHIDTIYKKADIDPFDARRYEKAVLGLDVPALKAWLNAFMLAEGTFKKMGTGSEALSQCPRANPNKCVAILTAVHLLGMVPQTSGKNITLSQNTHSPAMRLKAVSKGQMAVGCLQTETTNWVMKQGNHITITGNCSYDRSFLKPEYAIAGTTNRFYDGMSAFIATRGITNQQRAALKKHQKENIFVGDWVDETTTNSLDAVHQFYGLGELDKGVRDKIVDRGWPWVRLNLAEVSRYCIADVWGTIEVLQPVIAEWLAAQPNAISQLAQIELGSVWVPLSAYRWPSYADKADACVAVIQDEATAFLAERVELVKDQYLRATKAIAVEYAVTKKALKADAKDAGQTEEWVKVQAAIHLEEALDRLAADMPINLASLDWTPALSGKTKGLPKWYRDIKGDYSVRKRWAPLIMGMTWAKRPIYWDNEAVKPYENDKGDAGDRAGFVTTAGPVPHPEKRGKRVTSVFAKGFVAASEKGSLDAPDANASTMLKKYVSTTLWSSLQSRIRSLKVHDLEGFPVCIPRMAVTGTISRRCSDSVWQVLSNPKAKRIASELKSMVEAPKGYKIVGADVTAQEAWIACMLGDQLTGGYTGTTGFAYSIYIGDSAKKTDFHSLNAAKTGLSRNNAKVPGFATLYGAGVAGVTDYLLALDPSLTYDEARAIAQSFISAFKGDFNQFRSLAGGLASEAFNAMRMIANDPAPETPVLKAKLSLALAGIKDFSTTRTNWVVQSSGADFRDCLVVFGDYFFKILNIEGRLLLTIHDEIRYLVTDADVRKAAYALQLAHLYTRALFIRELGMDCLPASVAWFGQIDIDTVLRKEPDDPCVTPTQPDPIPPGYGLTASDLAEYLTA